MKHILAHGAIIQGTVEDLEVISWRPDSDSSTTTKPAYRHSYYATLRYEVRGMERKARLKLPNSGFTFDLVKGRATDLIVLDERPNTPLIRSVYFKRI